ncbi:MAG: hypothetical protein PHS14_00440 [Elusimicrobia bacterium]|nr:hypothetical protein [Elusimicrobiota bacterium]
MAEPENPKLCLSCARARLAQRPARACATCALLNIDPLASVRANSARPSPLAAFYFQPFRSTWISGAIVTTGQKPARARYGG